MAKIIRVLVWLISGSVASRISNNFLYNLFDTPASGVNLTQAIMPALGATIVMCFFIYQAFEGLAWKPWSSWRENAGRISIMKSNPAYSDKEGNGSNAHRMASMDSSMPVSEILVDKPILPPNENIKSDWDLACEYYKNLNILLERLCKLSPALGTTFQLEVLKSKEFDRALDIASQLEDNYLIKNFSSVKEIKDFAKELLLEGQIDAAKELSQAARVLGGNSSKTDEIIYAISKKYNTYRYINKIRPEVEWQRRNKERLDMLENYKNTGDIIFWMSVIFIVCGAGLVIFVT